MSGRLRKCSPTFTTRTLRLVLLDFLDTVVRRNADRSPDRAAAKAWSASLPQIVADRRAQSKARAKATRLLHRDASPVTTDQLSELVRDRVGRRTASPRELREVTRGAPGGCHVQVKLTLSKSTVISPLAFSANATAISAASRTLPIRIGRRRFRRPIS